MDVLQAMDTFKDKDFCAWLEANAERKDVQGAVETFLLTMHMHMRAAGALPELVEPLWKEYNDGKK